MMPSHPEWIASGAKVVLHLLSGGDDKPFNPIDLSNSTLLFWTVIVFVVLFVLMARFVWGPLMKTVGAREDRIRGDMEKAEAARVDAETSRVALQRDLEQAQQKAKALLDEASERASKLRTELETQARTDAESIVAKARAQIQAEKAQALQEIRDQVVDLSVEISKRLVAKAPGREDHLKEADAVIGRLRGLN